MRSPNHVLQGGRERGLIGRWLTAPRPAHNHQAIGRGSQYFGSSGSVGFS